MVTRVIRLSGVSCPAHPAGPMTSVFISNPRGAIDEMLRSAPDSRGSGVSYGPKRLPSRLVRKTGNEVAPRTALFRACFDFAPDGESTQRCAAQRATRSRGHELSQGSLRLSPIHAHPTSFLDRCPVARCSRLHGSLRWAYRPVLMLRCFTDCYLPSPHDVPLDRSLH